MRTETAIAPLLGVRPPATVDRLIVHQIDVAHPAPGGIDTCLRGMLRYAPDGTTIAVVGVDSGGGTVPGRRLGAWEQHRFGERTVWFMPVVALDPGDQRRTVPHALRLVVGLMRYRRRLPTGVVVQAHRADTAMAVSRLLDRPLAYFIHTQESGLTGATSDSMWRRAGNVHAAVERRLVTTAVGVVVFNPDYARTVAEHNPAAIFSPTWYDPALVRFAAVAADPYRMVWVGRLEEPKDPGLAVTTLARLVELDPSAPWSLDLVGSGTLLPDLQRQVAALPPDVRARVRLLGRLSPQEVAQAMGDAGSFLMTSYPGYEGFPRVLVEALASGLPAVVTEGSDTGGMVRAGHNGHVCERHPDDLARAVQSVIALDRSAVRATAQQFSAPHLVARIVDASSPSGS